MLQINRFSWKATFGLSIVLTAIFFVGIYVLDKEYNYQNCVKFYATYWPEWGMNCLSSPLLRLMH